jgi:hypothetical protein
LSFQLFNYDRYGGALECRFLGDLGPGYWRTLAHIVEHDLAIDVTNRVRPRNTDFFEIYASHGLDQYSFRLGSATILDKKFEDEK